MKIKKPNLRKLFENNPSVDPDAFRKSIELVEYIRRIGIKRRGFSISPTSAPGLKVKQVTRKLN